MKKRLLFVLSLLLCGYLGICGYFYLKQSDLIFQPDKEMVNNPASVGLSFREVQIETADGCKLNSWYVPCSGSSKIVIFFHGNKRNMSNNLRYLTFLNQLGFDSIIFDYRGYGKSTGLPSEQGLYSDAEAVWKYVTKDLGYTPDRIIIWGRSLGGGVAFEMALKYNPYALIMESTFTSIPDLASHRYPFLPAKWICKTQFNSLLKISQINSRKLFIHSPEDQVVPYKMGEVLYETASLPKIFLKITGGHDNADYLLDKKTRECVREFLK